MGREIKPNSETESPFLADQRPLEWPNAIGGGKSMEALYSFTTSAVGQSKQSVWVSGEIPFIIKLKLSDIQEAVKERGKLDSNCLNLAIRNLAAQDIESLNNRKNIGRRHYVDTDWTESMARGSNEWNSKYLKTVFIRYSTMNNAFSSHLVLIPVFCDEHWTLYAFSMTDRKLNILDSLPDATQGGLDPELRHENIRLQVCGALNITMETEFDMSENDFRNWKYEFPIVPRQQNSDDCGFFMFNFMRLWDRNQLIQSIPTFCDRFNLTFSSSYYFTFEEQKTAAESRHLRMDFLAYILSYKDNKAKLPPDVSRWIKNIYEETSMERKERQSWSRNLMKVAREGDEKKFNELLDGEADIQIPPACSGVDCSRDQPPRINSIQDGVTMAELDAADEGIAAETRINVSPGDRAKNATSNASNVVCANKAHDADAAPAANQSAEKVKEELPFSTNSVHRLRSILHEATAEGDRVLHIAARLGNKDFVRNILCKAGVLPEHPDKYQGSMFQSLLRPKLISGLSAPTSMHTCAAASDFEEGERTQAMWFAEFLRARNHRGETSLHEAVRWGSEELVDLLVNADAKLNGETSDALIQIVDDEETSPLYLATTLRKARIVNILTNKRRTRYPPSYTGPAGKTALHAAVLLDEGLSKQLLEWNPDLVNEPDESGSAPLHYLASNGGADIAKLLLEKNSDSAYFADSKGSLPLHVAAANGRVDIIKQLDQVCADCIWSLNDSGQSILHIAVEKKQKEVVKYVCGDHKFKGILNLRDKAGNTAIHSAVRTGNQKIFRILMRNKQVCLSLVDKEGHTPLDLAVLSLPAGLRYQQTPRQWILNDLVLAGADLGCCRWDHLKIMTGEADKEKVSKTMSKSAGLLAVCAVLILNIAFAAAFNVVKSYNNFADEKALDKQPISTRRSRARKHAFKAFVVSDALAFLFSTVTTFCCTFAGFSIMDMQTRFGYLKVGSACLRYAAVSMIVVFMLGLYVVVEPVDVRIAIVACVFALVAVTVLEATPVYLKVVHMSTLYRRIGYRALWYTVFHNRQLPFPNPLLVDHILQVILLFVVVCFAITGFSYL